MRGPASPRHIEDATVRVATIPTEAPESDALVLADGFSCREQNRAGQRRAALGLLTALLATAAWAASRRRLRR